MGVANADHHTDVDGSVAINGIARSRSADGGGQGIWVHMRPLPCLVDCCMVVLYGCTVAM
jgi:hypothetical protein